MAACKSYRAGWTPTRVESMGRRSLAYRALHAARCNCSPGRAGSCQHPALSTASRHPPPHHVDVLQRGLEHGGAGVGRTRPHVQPQARHLLHRAAAVAKPARSGCRAMRGMEPATGAIQLRASAQTTHNQQHRPAPHTHTPSRAPAPQRGQRVAEQLVGHVCLRQEGARQQLLLAQAQAGAGVDVAVQVQAAGRAGRGGWVSTGANKGRAPVSEEPTRHLPAAPRSASNRRTCAPPAPASPALPHRIHSCSTGSAACMLARTRSVTGP